MQKAEDYWHEKEGSAGCEDETANYCAAERRVLLAAVTETKRHREHADDHRRRRHDDRAQAACASFQRCLQRSFSFLEMIACEGHDQDRIRSSDAEGHDRTH